MVTFLQITIYILQNIYRIENIHISTDHLQTPWVYTLRQWTNLVSSSFWSTVTEHSLLEDQQRTLKTCISKHCLPLLLFYAAA